MVDDLSMTVFHDGDVNLPIVKSPMRFAVCKDGGTLNSNSWKVEVGRKGDVYILCRDAMSDQKVSLHISGRRHIAFDSDSGIEVDGGDRFIDKWCHPVLTATEDGREKVTPDFVLMFPKWALGLNQSDRNKSGRWSKDVFAIESEDDNSAVVVSLSVVRQSILLNATADGSPIFALARIPVDSEQHLLATAHLVDDTSMYASAENVMDNMRTFAADKLRGVPSGSVVQVCATGRGDDGSAFMMPFFVDVEWNDRVE